MSTQAAYCIIDAENGWNWKRRGYCIHLNGWTLVHLVWNWGEGSIVLAAAVDGTSAWGDEEEAPALCAAHAQLGWCSRGGLLGYRAVRSVDRNGTGRVEQKRQRRRFPVAFAKQLKEDEVWAALLGRVNTLGFSLVTCLRWLHSWQNWLRERKKKIGCKEKE